ncbi:MAG: hypothetical protein A2X36_06405 [Elusimicrobia bacterium GWA2_69_24]|nr:MAG: hypothetical protein A2X36_06405 [Elusimicrobia bacterium GWA2_69_24]
MILGLHCSLRGGYLAALRHAESLGCGAIQVFTYRRHHAPSEAELAEFRAAAKGRLQVVAHARFVPCLASAEPRLAARSSELLADEVRIARAFGAAFYVLHLGAYSEGSDSVAGTRLFAEGVRRSWQDSGDPLLVLENVPGGGRRLGGELEELARALEALDRVGVRAGVCLDTAHAWAQGYDIADAGGMEAFLDHAERIFGPERLALFHLNNTRTGRGSHREDHWHIDGGMIKEGAWTALLSRKTLAGVPGILETPSGLEMDAANLAAARRAV